MSALPLASAALLCEITVVSQSVDLLHRLPIASLQQLTDTVHPPSAPFYGNQVPAIRHIW